MSSRLLTTGAMRCCQITPPMAAAQARPFSALWKECPLGSTNRVGSLAP
jgi:hypothetical protein